MCLLSWTFNVYKAGQEAEEVENIFKVDVLNHALKELILRLEDRFAAPP